MWSFRCDLVGFWFHVEVVEMSPLKSGSNFPGRKMRWLVGLGLSLLSLGGVVFFASSPNETQPELSKAQALTAAGGLVDSVAKVPPSLVRTEEMGGGSIASVALRVNENWISVRTIDLLHNKPVAGAKVWAENIESTGAKLEGLSGDPTSPQAFTDENGWCRVAYNKLPFRLVARTTNLYGARKVFGSQVADGVALKLFAKRDLEITVANQDGTPVSGVLASLALVRPGFVKRIRQEKTNGVGKVVFRNYFSGVEELPSGSQVIAVLEGVFANPIWEVVESRFKNNPRVNFVLPPHKILKFGLVDNSGEPLMRAYQPGFRKPGPRLNGWDPTPFPEILNNSGASVLYDGGVFGIPIEQGVPWEGSCWMPECKSSIEPLAIVSSPNDFDFIRPRPQVSVRGCISAMNSPELARMISLWNGSSDFTTTKGGDFVVNVWKRPQLPFRRTPFLVTSVDSTRSRLTMVPIFLVGKSPSESGILDLGDIEVKTKHNFSLQITDTQGEPIEGASVKVTPYLSHSFPLLPCKHDAFYSSDTGQIEVVGSLDVEFWHISVKHPLFKEESRMIPANENSISIKMSGFARIEGEVLLGEAVRKTELRIGLEGAEFNWEKPGPQISGPVSWTGLPAGSYSVYISDATSGEKIFALNNLTLSESGTLYPAELQPLDLLERLFVYDLSVSSPAGLPAEMVKILFSEIDSEEKLVSNPCSFVSRNPSISVGIRTDGGERSEHLLVPGENLVQLNEITKTKIRFYGGFESNNYGRLAIAVSDGEEPFNYDDLIWVEDGEVVVPINDSEPHLFRLLLFSEDDPFAPPLIIKGGKGNPWIITTDEGSLILVELLLGEELFPTNREK